MPQKIKISSLGVGYHYINQQQNSDCFWLVPRFWSLGSFGRHSRHAVTIAANNTQTHKIYEIAGVDRVYFKINSSLDADDEMFAAGSTFRALKEAKWLISAGHL